MQYQRIGVISQERFGASVVIGGKGSRLSHRGECDSHEEYSGCDRSKRHTGLRFRLSPYSASDRKRVRQEEDRRSFTTTLRNKCPSPSAEAPEITNTTKLIAIDSTRAIIFVSYPSTY